MNRLRFDFCSDGVEIDSVLGLAVTAAAGAESFAFDVDASVAFFGAAFAFLAGVFAVGIAAFGDDVDAVFVEDSTGLATTLALSRTTGSLRIELADLTVLADVESFPVDAGVLVSLLDAAGFGLSFGVSFDFFSGVAFFSAFDLVSTVGFSFSVAFLSLAADLSSAAALLSAGGLLPAEAVCFWVLDLPESRGFASFAGIVPAAVFVEGFASGFSALF